MVSKNIIIWLESKQVQKMLLVRFLWSPPPPPPFFPFHNNWSLCVAFGGRGSSAVERATPGEEVPGSIPAVAARSLQAGSVSV